jgi:NDP-sugar pyrophosphorylase family protein
MNFGKGSKMHELTTNYYFSLEEFPYKELFEGSHFVWEALAKLSLFLEEQPLGKIEGKVSAGAHLVNPELITIGKGTVVEPGAFIRGPCIIGKDCEIRHGAYIRGNVVTGNDCVIGHATEIKRSILLNHVCAGHFNYVGDSILGNRANLGAGVKCANLRLDHNTISILFQGEKFQTHLNKFGAVIGDDAQLGCNCVTNPGTLIGKETFCHPCINVCGVIPPFSKVKSAHKVVIQEHVDANID